VKEREVVSGTAGLTMAQIVVIKKDGVTSGATFSVPDTIKDIKFGKCVK
jgi:hypothetical protein